MKLPTGAVSVWLAAAIGIRQCLFQRAGVMLRQFADGTVEEVSVAA